MLDATGKTDKDETNDTKKIESAVKKLHGKLSRLYQALRSTHPHSAENLYDASIAVDSFLGVFKTEEKIRVGKEAQATLAALKKE